MAWLFHPDDYDELAKATRGTLPPTGLPLGAVQVRRCFCLERGRVQDTDHPELGAPTFAEFGERYAKVLEDERRAFDKAVAVLEKMLAPMRPMPFPSRPSVALDLDKP